MVAEPRPGCAHGLPAAHSSRVSRDKGTLALCICLYYIVWRAMPSKSWRRLPFLGPCWAPEQDGCRHDAPHMPRVNFCCTVRQPSWRPMRTGFSPGLGIGRQGTPAFLFNAFCPGMESLGHAMASRPTCCGLRPSPGRTPTLHLWNSDADTIEDAEEYDSSPDAADHESVWHSLITHNHVMRIPKIVFHHEGTGFPLAYTPAPNMRG